MSSGAESSSLASSLTDLMTSLAVIFVLLLVASLNNISGGRDTVADLRNLLLALLKEFQPNGVDVKVDEKDPLVLLVIVPEDLFRFEFNKADIPQAGNRFLEKFAPKLVEGVCDRKLRDDIASVVVEGHADYRGSDEANLNISQQRASAVVIKTLDILRLGGHEDLSACFKDLVSASGRGAADPLPDPDRSRRVIFKIRARSAEQELTRIVGDAAAHKSP
jgi:outer membrane protein OmpA-like peptidoglycan-associated protein